MRRRVKASRNEGAIMIALLMLALQVAGPVETIDAPIPSGFKVGFKAAQADQSIEERVPTGETVEAWTRMVTVQRFGGPAQLGPHAFAERLGGLMARACPGAVLAPIVDGRDGAVAIATMRLDCPLNPATGKPETMFGRAFAGQSDLYVSQYAVRAKGDAAITATAGAYLDSVHVRK
jgi:hypothetical protein